MPDCTICGRRMVEFKNPTRYICPTSEAEHNKIELQEKQRRKGDRHTGSKPTDQMQIIGRKKRKKDK